MALTDKDECTDYLDIKKDTEDEIIDAFRAAAEKWFLNKTELPIEETEYTEYHDGDGFTDYFHTDNYPITSTAAEIVLYDDTDHDYESDTLVATDDFLVYGDTGKIRLKSKSPFSEGAQNIKITYEAGYATVPDDVKLAIWILVALLYRNRKDRREGLTSKSAEGGTISFLEQEAPAFVISVIDNYKRAMIAR